MTDTLLDSHLCRVYKQEGMWTSSCRSCGIINKVSMWGGALLISYEHTIKWKTVRHKCKIYVYEDGWYLFCKDCNKSRILSVSWDEVIFLATQHLIAYREKFTKCTRIICEVCGNF